MTYAHVGVAAATVACLFIPVAQESERWGALAGLPQLIVLALSVWEVGGLIVAYGSLTIAGTNGTELNLAALEALSPAEYSGELKLFLEYGNSGIEAVPDPYYGTGDGFERVLDMVENSSQHLLQYIQQTHQL